MSHAKEDTLLMPHEKLAATVVESDVILSNRTDFRILNGVEGRESS